MIYTTRNSEFRTGKGSYFCRTAQPPEVVSLEGPGPRRKGIPPKEQETPDKGRGKSGPVGKVARLKSITMDLEEQVASRMRTGRQ
jgi:hypothetical protein